MTFGAPLQEDIDNPPIKSQRYRLRGRAGRGSWGRVYVFEDKEFPGNSLTNQGLVAIKVIEPSAAAREQMQERGIETLEEVIKKECAELANCRSIVPRRFERDETGKGYIVMPYIPTFLSDLMRELRTNIPQKQGLGYILSIAEGLAEAHTELRIVHGDLKKENVAIKNQNALLTDFGSSTAYNGKSPRERLGEMQTRAPEVYDENSRPSARSDVWGAASLSYAILTGSYIFEAEFSHGVTPEEIFGDAKQYKKLVKQKLKRVPKQIRKVLERSLELEPLKRQYNGEQLHFELQEAINNMDEEHAMRKYVKKVMAIALPAAAAVGIFGLTRLVPDEPSPAMMKPPTIIYTTASLNEKPLEYIREDIALPMYRREIGAAVIGFEPQLQHTKDRQVAYLAAQFEQASCLVNKHRCPCNARGAG
jgi:serine/threonine protein kinase